MGDGKHTENKEIYPSFKKSGDSGLWKDNEIFLSLLDLLDYTRFQIKKRLSLSDSISP